MPPLVVSRSWTWLARARLAAANLWLTWAVVALVTIGGGPAWATLAAFLIGLLMLALLGLFRGPSVTEVAVAGALRTGVAPAGLSITVVDTEAARIRRAGRWLRFEIPVVCLVVLGGLAIVIGRGGDSDRIARWAVYSIIISSVVWATRTSVREANRWLANDAQHWIGQPEVEYHHPAG